jgi:hypothetical protein
MSNKSKDLSLPEKEALPVNRKLPVTDRLAVVIGDTLAPRPNIPIGERLTFLTPEQKAKLQEIEDNAIISFAGSIDELESALGMLRIGHHFGWKVLYLIHSKKTVRKYEEILGIKVREIFPETGASSDRSIGLSLAIKASNFWKVVSGEEKIENRRKIK